MAQPLLLGLPLWGRGVAGVAFRFSFRWIRVWYRPATGGIAQATARSIARPGFMVPHGTRRRGPVSAL